MGSGFSDMITINFDRFDSFYYTDERVTGTVLLSLAEEPLEAEQVHLTLTGEIGYTTTRTVTDGRGGSTRHTEYHNIPIYSAKIILAQRQVDAERLVLNQGQHSWPFEMRLPNYLPSTINRPQSYPHVRYYLQVVIEKAWYKPNVRKTRYLTVFPRVNLIQNPQCLTSTLFGSQNRKDISLRGTINRTGFVPDDTVTVTLTVHNPRRILIECIDFSILQSYRIAANSGQTTLFETTLPRILDLRDQYIEETFSLHIPATRLPPSYDFQGGLRSVVNVHLHYMAKFSVKVQGIFTNFHAEVPIILGTEPLVDFYHQQTCSLQSTFLFLQPIHPADNDDAPPDYDTAVQSIK